MKRTTVLMALIFACFAGIAQDIPNPIHEARKVIKENIQNFGYCDDKYDITNKYVVGFNDTSMVIFDTKELTTYYNRVSFKDIDSVQVEHHKTHSTITLHLSTALSQPLPGAMHKYHFHLHKAIRKQGRAHKVAAAFVTLINEF